MGRLTEIIFGVVLLALAYAVVMLACTMLPERCYLP